MKKGDVEVDEDDDGWEPISYHRSIWQQFRVPKHCCSKPSLSRPTIATKGKGREVALTIHQLCDRGEGRSRQWTWTHISPGQDSHLSAGYPCTEQGFQQFFQLNIIAAWLFCDWGRLIRRKMEFRRYIDSFCPLYLYFLHSCLTVVCYAIIFFLFVVPIYLSVSMYFTHIWNHQRSVTFWSTATLPTSGNYMNNYYTNSDFLWREHIAFPY